MRELSCKATVRKGGVRSVSKKLLRDDKIAAVYYNKDENIPITIDRHTFEKSLPTLKTNTVFALELEGQEKKALLQAMDFFRTTGRVRHIDFLGLKSDEQTKVKVPVTLTGLAIGVTKGGVLRKFVNSLRVFCKSEAIPEEIAIDISKMDVGDIVTVKDLMGRLGKVDYKINEPLSKPIVSVASSRATVMADEQPAEGALTSDEETEQKPAD